MLKIKNMSIRQRLMSLGAIVFIAFLYVEFSYINQIWQQKELRITEQNGIAQVRPIFPVFQHLLITRDSILYYLYSKAILKKSREELVKEINRLETLLQNDLTKITETQNPNKYSKNVVQLLSQVNQQWQKAQGA